MRTNRANNSTRHSQQFKLSAFLDFYESDPNEQYRLVAEDGCIKTVIGYPEECSENQCYSSNNISGHDFAQKSGGLFGNIIKNMKENKSPYHHKLVASPTPPRKPYCFYYNELERQTNQPSPLRQAASAKRVKERATGITDMNSFRQTQLNTRQGENQNILNHEQPFKDALTKMSREKEANSQQPKNEGLALDFSFQDNSGETSEKSQPFDNNRPEINIVDKDKKQQSCEKVSKYFIVKEQQTINEKEQPKEENIIPQIIIHEKQREESNKEIFSPIPHKIRHEFRHQFRQRQKSPINVAGGNQPGKKPSCVEGAKQVESRIYQHNSKQEDPKDIRIDFDLDLNFI